MTRRPLLLALLLPALASATPYLPSGDGEVLEVLPARRLVLQSLPVAASLPPARRETDIRNLLMLAQREGDPRYLGYAEAQLAQLPDSPARALLRARLRQSQHRFGEAQAELAEALRKLPGDPEALLLQASIHLVRGDYDRAHESCSRLSGLAILPLALACRAQVDGLRGQGETALRQLRQLSTLGDGLAPDQRTWLQLALGDLALRLGDDELAGAAYRSVHANSVDARAAYADWLLATGRPAAAVTLLRDFTRSDALLLRLALAEQRLGLPAATAHARELRQRFDALAARGDGTHLREAAVLALLLEKDAARALDLARRNWEQQREPADLLLYVRAARATGSQRDLALLRDWRRARHLQDRRLDREIATR